MFRINKNGKNNSNKKGWGSTLFCVFLLFLFLGGTVGCKREQPSKTLTVLLVRHAKTVANDEGIIMGGKSESPLSDEGRAEAWELGERLKDVKIDAVYTSELLRTRETAKLVLLKNKEGCEDINTDAGLNDIDLGLYEGRSAEELFTLYGGDFINTGIGGIYDEEFVSPIEGETAYKFVERFKNTMTEICDGAVKKGDSTILVVAHSSACYFLQSVLGDPSYDHLDNASVTVLKYTDGSWSIDAE